MGAGADAAAGGAPPSRQPPASNATTIVAQTRRREVTPNRPTPGFDYGPAARRKCGAGRVCASTPRAHPLVGWNLKGAALADGSLYSPSCSMRIFAAPIYPGSWPDTTTSPEPSTPTREGSMASPASRPSALLHRPIASSAARWAVGVSDLRRAFEAVAGWEAPGSPREPCTGARWRPEAASRNALLTSSGGSRTWNWRTSGAGCTEPPDESGFAGREHEVEVKCSARIPR
jgi:hypothetical protein